MRFQPIYDIAELCSRKGIQHVVLCPGSRCAPLTLAFTRHPSLKPKTFSDERSAGFVALGMAQSTHTPAVVVCTSGSAVYNLAPAVAEAFFSQTPLVVLTADRPAEWIAQHDGQTIYQNEIFGKHVKKYFQLPQEYEHADNTWAINRMVNDAINLSRQQPPGPVHINIPFREPLYPSVEEQTSYSKKVRVIEEYNPGLSLTEDQRKKIKAKWNSYVHVLIVAGQQPSSEALAESLERFFAQQDVPIVCDVISNLQGIERAVRHADLFLGQASDDLRKTLCPDLLITFGQSLISKNVKLFLRNHPPKEHWHIQPGGVATDTFKTLTDVFQADPVSFFDYLSTVTNDPGFEDQKRRNYGRLWEVEDRRADRTLASFLEKEEFGELHLVNEVMKQLPGDCNLHLANSMSVRYGNFIGLEASQKKVRVFSNRGTSGIDGCTSTSVGNCLATEKPTVLITGDVAFFYDRNAFWHNYPIGNLRIVLLNNHGGLIFNVIDGPAALPETPEYFVTRQKLTARKLCEEFSIDYLPLDNKRKIKNTLKDFFDFDGRPKLLELETDVAFDKASFDHLKQKIKKSYEL